MLKNNYFQKPEEFQKPEVFRDPIYGYIYFDYIFLEQLINTSVMQRLRRIKQLSFVNIIFSGAEHSRFTHSLGVYELARRFLETNSKFLEKKKIFDLRKKLLLLTAALLHDIGHGSYSHVFEIIFQTKHEQKSSQIIMFHPEIISILDTIDIDFKFDVASIIAKKNKFILIEQLLTSQLDFDRLDYLTRDSFFTGVSYGSIDSDRLIRSIDIENNRLVFKKSGITAIENYLINRYHMYWQVYYHPKVRGYAVILEKVFTRIKFLLEKNYSFEFNNILFILKKFLKTPDDILAYLEIDDFYINSLIIYFKNEKDQILSNLCNDFLNRHIWDYVDNIPEKQNKILQINDFYKENKDYYTYNQNVYQNAYREDKKNIGDQILIFDYAKLKIKKLSEESTIINSLIKSKIKKEDCKFFYRKYLEKNDI